MPGKYWEPKLSELLVQPYFWKHKCPDSRHGGQAKIDFYVVNQYGHFKAIEVKTVNRQRADFYVYKDGEGVTPLQAHELNAIANMHCNTYIAVGHMKEALYFFDWVEIKDKKMVTFDWAAFTLSWGHGRKPDIKSLLDIL